MFYGDLQVAVLTETRFPSWSITEMKIAYVSYVRTCVQTHCLSFIQKNMFKPIQTSHLLRLNLLTSGKYQSVASHNITILLPTVNGIELYVTGVRRFFFLSVLLYLL